MCIAKTRKTSAIAAGADIRVSMQAGRDNGLEQCGWKDEILSHLGIARVIQFDM